MTISVTSTEKKTNYDPKFCIAVKTIICLCLTLPWMVQHAVQTLGLHWFFCKAVMD